MSTLVLVIAVIGVRTYFLHRAETELGNVVAETESSDPRWRFDQILEDRVTPADDDNGAHCVVRVNKRLGQPGKFEQEDILTELPANEILPEDLQTKLRAYLQEHSDAAREGRQLANFPAGRYTIEWNRNSLLATLMGDLLAARPVASLLKCDAILSAHDGEMGRAITDCRAAINAGRSIGDEPMIVALVLRIKAAEKGLISVEHVLAQGTCPAEALLPLQTLLEGEAREPLLVVAIRGERALWMETLQQVLDRSGGLGDLNDPVPRGSSMTRSIFEPIPVVIAQTACIRWMTRMVEISKEPIGRQAQDFHDVRADLRTRVRHDKSLIIPALMAPPIARCARRHREYVARLNCTAVAVAMERYRLAVGAWPGSLEELVPQFLNHVPEDPLGDGPLQIDALPDGIVIRSATTREPDEDDLNLGSGEAGEASFRLWNPDKRRQGAPVR